MNYLTTINKTPTITMQMLASPPSTTAAIKKYSSLTWDFAWNSYNKMANGGDTQWPLVSAKLLIMIENMNFLLTSRRVCWRLSCYRSLTPWSLTRRSRRGRAPPVPCLAPDIVTLATAPQWSSGRWRLVARSRTQSRKRPMTNENLSYTNWIMLL